MLSFAAVLMDKTVVTYEDMDDVTVVILRQH